MIGNFSKAKAAKLIRDLVDRFLDMKSSTGREVELCQQCIDWAKTENRVFLRQALEARLVALYVDRDADKQALTIAGPLLKELKKIDDKALLVEVQLMESKAYQKLDNITRSRAALTSAKTTANGIYCPPRLQSALDLQSGVLHAEEKDFKTAYSYFYEAFEGYDSVDSPMAITALKYMLLCKIMLGIPEDVQSVVSGKMALKYSGIELEVMQNIAKACRSKSISELERVVEEHRQHVSADPIVKSHLEALNSALLEKNLLQIIEPYSKVEVQHVAREIKLPQDEVERKLSRLILDKSLNGILDQGQGVLIVYENSGSDQTYSTGLEVISRMGKVVDSLYSQTKQLP
ncbi:26S proteasome non-ATPase regulatory subunit 11 [Geodia barretti]|nr:26S proteasome non-ATPase regulatory subunit 11 [Geodia barretti]